MTTRTITPILVLLILLAPLLAIPMPSHAQDTTCVGDLNLVIGEQGWSFEGSTLRAEPDDTLTTGFIYPGAVFTVLEGPRCVEGFYWWQVAYDGIIGWIADYGLRPLPADTDTSNATLTPTDSVDFNGVRFAYDPAVWGAQVQAFSTATQVWYSLEDGTWVGMPMSRRFTFFQHQPAASLIIYPVDNWHNDEAAGLALATRLLVEKRAEIDLSTATGELPTLPIRRAAQNIRAQRAFIEGADVAGFRFITRYTQSFVPFTGDDLLYTFQGYSTDGRYYISFSVPIALPDLPAQLPNLDEMMDSDEGEGFQAFADYTAQAEAAINAMDAGIAVYDALVQSLTVSDPTTQPAFFCEVEPQWQLGDLLTFDEPRGLVASYGWDAESGTLEAGSQALLVDGPACAMGYVWWQVDAGWIHE